MNSFMSALPGRCLLLLGGYLGLALLSPHLSSLDLGIPAIWLANALACAMLVGNPPRHWPALLGSMTLAATLAQTLTQDTSLTSFYLQAPHLLEVVVAAWLLRRCSAAKHLHHNPRALIKTLLRGCLWPVLLSASLNATLINQLQPGDYGDYWLISFASSCIGSLAMLPLFLHLQQRSVQQNLAEFSSLLSPALLLLCLGLSLLALQFLPFPFVYIGLPLLLTAFYLSFANVALIGSTMAIMISMTLSTGFFPLPPMTATWQSLLLYLPIAAVLLPPLLLASSLQQSRQREQDFRLSEERFRGALAFAGTGFALATHDGEIREANQRLGEILDYPPEQLPGLQLLDLTYPEDRRLHSTHLQNLLQGRCNYFAIEQRLLNRQGAPLWTHVTISLLPGKGGSEELIVQIEDIREKVEAQQKQKLMRMAAEKANRTKNEFLANMSHEFRTPMSGVMGIVQLLEHTELTRTQRKYLDMLRDAGNALLAVINDILDFAKIESGHLQLNPTAFALDDLLSRMASLMTVIAGDRDLELLIHVDAQVPPQLLLDRQRLEQVLINLTSNAIKFTRQGEVELNIGLRQLNGHPRLQITVRDTGIGMSPQQQERLLDLREPGTDNHTQSQSGAGIGLAISMRLIALMGGSLSVQSQPEKGSSFSFDLPLKTAEPAALPAAPPADLAGLRILLVDDNLRCRQVLWQLLSDCRCSVDCAESQEQALAFFRQAQQSKRPYQLLLLDWSLPNNDGLRCYARLKGSFGREVPPTLLMVNAFARDQLASQSQPLPVTGLLLKPITRNELHEHLREALQTIAPATPLPDANPVALQGSRLLLVEDDALNRIVIKSLLEQLGAQVLTASDGQEAVNLLRARQQTIDAVLMDVQMPGLDGISATRLIRQDLGHQLPILAMSAGVSGEEQKACLEAGMNDFIAKPIELNSLLATLHRHRHGSSAAAVSASNETGHLNPETLNLLCSADEPTYTSITRLVADLLQRGLAPVQDIRECWQADRSEEAARLTHTLRGSLGTLGATALPGLTVQLETALRQAQHPHIPQLLSQLEEEYGALLLALEHWLNEHPLAAS